MSPIVSYIILLLVVVLLCGIHPTTAEAGCPLDGQTVSVTSPIVDCPQSTGAIFQANTVNLVFRNLALSRPTFTFPIALSVQSFYVTDCAMTDVATYYIWTDFKMAPSGVIVIRNNTIIGSILVVMMHLTLTLANVSVLVVDNRVEFGIANNEPQAYYMLLSSAILDTNVSLTAQDNYVTVSGSTSNSTTMRVVELRHAGLSSTSGVRLDISRNHLDAGEAGCAGDQCVIDPSVVYYSNVGFEATILSCLYMIINFESAVIKENTISWSSKLTRRHVAPRIVALYYNGTVTTRLDVRDNQVRFDGSKGGVLPYTDVFLFYAGELFAEGTIVVINNTILNENFHNIAANSAEHVFIFNYATISGTILVEGNTVTRRNLTLIALPVNGAQWTGGVFVGYAVIPYTLLFKSNANLTIRNNLFSFDVSYYRIVVSTNSLLNNLNMVYITNTSMEPGSSLTIEGNTIQSHDVYLGELFDGVTYTHSRTVTAPSVYHRLVLVGKGFRMNGAVFRVVGNTVNVTGLQTGYAAGAGAAFTADTPSSSIIFSNNSAFEVSDNIILVTATETAATIRVIEISLYTGSTWTYTALSQEAASSFSVTDNQIISNNVNTTTITINMVYVAYIDWTVSNWSTVTIDRNTIHVVSNGSTCHSVIAIQIQVSTWVLEGSTTTLDNTISAEIGPEGDADFTKVDSIIRSNFVNPIKLYVCHRAFVYIFNINNVSTTLLGTLWIQRNSIVFYSPAYPFPTVSVAIAYLSNFPVTIGGTFTITDNTVDTTVTFLCRMWGAGSAAIVRNTDALSMELNGGRLSIKKNSLKIDVKDDLTVRQLDNTSSCVQNSASISVFGVYLRISISKGVFTYEDNIVKARLDGRAFVIGRYYFATLVVDIQSLSSTDAVTLLNNSFIVTTDHALDKLDVPQFALDEGMTIMQMCSNAPIYIAVDGTDIPNEVSSAAAVVVAANTLDIPATLETWGSCVLSAVSYTAFPDSTVALIARENTFGLRVNSSSTLASAIVGGIVVAGTLRTLTVGVSGRDTLQTYNNTIFMAHVGPADFGDFDNQIMPVRLAPLTLASNRPSWWACSNYIRIGQEEDTALNSIPAPKTLTLSTMLLATTLNKVSTADIDVRYCISGTPSSTVSNPTPTIKATRSHTASNTPHPTPTDTHPATPTHTPSTTPSGHTSTPSQSGTNSSLVTVTSSLPHTPTTTMVGTTTSTITHVTSSQSKSIQRHCSELVSNLVSTVLNTPAYTPQPLCTSSTTTYPIQALWFGSLSDPMYNTSTSQPTVTTLRTSLLLTPSSCIHTDVPINVDSDKWGSSSSTVEFAIGGGRGGSSTTMYSRIPGWAFHDILPPTIATLNQALVVSLLPVYTTTNTEGAPIADPTSILSITLVKLNTTTTSNSTSSLRLRIKHQGPSSTQSGYRVVIKMPVMGILRCTGVEQLSMTINLLAPKPLVNTGDVADGVGVASAVATGLTGSPGGVVRGGMLSSLSDLLRCEPNDLTQEQSLLANPFNLPLGKAQGQYYRGGILSSMLLLVGLTIVICGLMIPLKMSSLRKEYHLSIPAPPPATNPSSAAATVPPTDGGDAIPAPTWKDAFRHSYLPGMLLVPMAIVGESWVPNGATLVSMPDADLGDIILGVAVLVVFTAYVVHLLFTTKAPPVAVRRLQQPTQRNSKKWAFIMSWLRSPVGLVPTEIPAGRVDGLTRNQYSDFFSYTSIQKMLRGDDGQKVRSSIVFHLRFAPYVDELNLLWFKSVELALGNVINLASGIITDRCFVQGFTVLVVIAIVFGILVIKRPMAVPIQQHTTMVVYGSMLVAAIVVVANLFVQHSTLEQAATVLFLISTAFTVLQAVTDILVSILTAHALFERIVRKRKILPPTQPKVGGDAVMNQQNEEHLQELIGSDVSDNGTDDGEGGDEIIDIELEEVQEEEDEHQVRDQILAELEEADEEMAANERRHQAFWSRL